MEIWGKWCIAISEWFPRPRQLAWAGKLDSPLRLRDVCRSWCWGIPSASLKDYNRKCPRISVKQHTPSIRFNSTHHPVTQPKSPPKTVLPTWTNISYPWKRHLSFHLHRFLLEIKRICLHRLCYGLIRGYGRNIRGAKETRNDDISNQDEAWQNVKTKLRKKKQLLTLPHGFAIKVGIIPYFIPTLLANNLNKTALSAIRRASVYSRADSKTPGPVSVSVMWWKGKKWKQSDVSGSGRWAMCERVESGNREEKTYDVLQ